MNYNLSNLTSLKTAKFISMIKPAYLAKLPCTELLGTPKLPYEIIAPLRQHPLLAIVINNLDSDTLLYVSQNVRYVHYLIDKKLGLFFTYSFMPPTHLPKRCQLYICFSDNPDHFVCVDERDYSQIIHTFKFDIPQDFGCVSRIEKNGETIFIFDYNKTKTLPPKDLTREGIEPNPGWIVYEDYPDTVAEAANHSSYYIRMSVRHKYFTSYHLAAELSSEWTDCDQDDIQDERLDENFRNPHFFDSEQLQVHWTCPDYGCHLYTQDNEHINTRHQFKKDLTKEGIEPNPGWMYIKDIDQFITFLEHALTSDVQHHQTRTILKEQFSDCITFKETRYAITYFEHGAIFSLLCSTGRALTDDQTLNFRNTISRLHAQYTNDLRKHNENKKEKEFGQCDLADSSFITALINLDKPYLESYMQSLVNYSSMDNFQTFLTNHLVHLTNMIDQIEIKDRNVYLGPVILARKLKIPETSVIHHLKIRLIIFFDCILKVDEVGIQAQASKVKNFLDKLRESSSSDTEDPKPKTKWSQLPTTLSHIGDSLEKATDTFGPQFDKFNETVDALRVDLKNFLNILPTNIIAPISQIISIFCTLMAVLLTDQKTVRALLIVSLAGLVLPHLVEPITKLIVYFKNKINAWQKEKEDKIEAQALDPVTGLETSEPDAITENGIIAIFDVFKHMFQSTDLKTKNLDLKRVATLRAYASAVKTFKDFNQFFFSCLHEWFSHLYEYVAGVPYNHDPIVYTHLQNASLFINDVTELSRHDLSVYINQSTFRHRVHMLQHNSIHLQKTLNELNLQLTNSKISLFQKCVTRVEKLYEIVTSYEKEDNGRIRPVIVWLNGAPNVGKSNLMDFILKDLCTIFKMQYGGKARYCYNPEDKFWSNYEQNAAVFIDDFLQHKDVDTVTAMLLLIINLGKNTTYQLNMPDVNSKGRTFFTSPIIFLTSNGYKDINNNKLQNLNAFKRRIDFIFDVSKVNVTQESWTRDRYRLIRLNSDYNDEDNIIWTKDGKAVLNYPDALDMIAAKMHNYAKEDGNIVKFLKKAPTPDPILAIAAKYQITAQMTKLKKIFTPKDPAPIDAERLLAEFNNEVEVAKSDHQDKAAEEQAIQLDEALRKAFAESESKRTGIPPEAFYRPDQRVFVDDKNEVVPPKNFKEHLSNDSTPSSSKNVPDPQVLQIQKDFKQVVQIEKTVEKLKQEEKKNVQDFTDAVADVIESKEISDQEIKEFKDKVEKKVDYTKIAAISTCIAVSGAILAGLAIWKFTSKTVKIHKEDNTNEESQDPENVQQGGALGAYHKVVVNKRLPTKSQVPKKVFTPVAEKSQSLDNSACNLIEKVLPDSYCDLQIGDYAANGVAVFGRTILTVGHLGRDLLEQKESLIIKYRNRVQEFRNSDIKVISAQDEDQMYITIKDKSFDQVPDITHHFMNRDDVPVAWTSPVSLASRCRGNYINRYSEIPPKPIEAIAYDDSRQRPCVNSSSFAVSMPGYNGECASLYVMHNTKIQAKIFGIHVAGGKQRAIGSIVTREDLDDIKSLLSNGDVVANSIKADPITLYLPCELLPPNKECFDYEKIQCSNVEILGSIPKNFAPSQPTGSDREPSLLHNMWQETPFKTAMLKPDRKRGVYPFEVGLSKKLVREKNTHKSQYAQEVADYLVSRMPQLVEPRILTVDEALNGVKGWYYVNSIDTSTSPGWPYNIEKGKPKGKLGVLIGEQGSWKLRPDIQEKLEFNIAQHKQGKRVYPIANNQLKDEELPAYKVQLPDGTPVGDTRITNGFATDAYVEEKMLTGAFLENTMRWQPRGDCFTELGINPHTHAPFLQIFKRLTRRGMANAKNWRKIRAAAGDFSKQDACEGEEISKWFRYILVTWYRLGGLLTEEELLWLETADLDMSQVVFLVMNLLYFCWGNPSGRFLTTLKNSFVTYFLICMTAIHSYFDKEIYKTRKMTVQEICEHVYEFLVTFGDDHVYTFDDNDWFDMFDIEKECKKWGFKYTSCYKNQELVASYELQDVKFLQRKFYYEKGILHAALDKDIIEDIVYWKSKYLDHENSLRATMNAALLEAYHHGEEYFNELKIKYNKVMSEFGFRQSTLKYADINRDFFNLSPAFARSQPSKKFTFSLNPIDTIKALKIEEIAQMETVSDASRAEKDSPVVTIVGPTAFADNVGKQTPNVENTDIIAPVNSSADPYPDEGPGKTLERVFPVYTFNWLSGDAKGDQVAALTFPHYLYIIPAIQEKLNYFEMLNAAVRVSVRISASRNLLGALLVCWLPHYDPLNGVTNVFQNMYTASSLNTSILSAQTTTSLDFVIPYVAPSDYWNMEFPSDTEARGWMGAIGIYVLAPLTQVNSGDPITVPVSIYASFVKPTVAGLGLRGSASEKRSKKPLPPPSKKFGNIRSPDGKTEVTKDKNVRAQSQKVEQDLRSKENTIAADNTASKPSGFVKTLSDIVGTVGEVAKIATMFLNKPTSTQAVQKTINKQMTSFANSRGLDGADKLALDPENHISADVKAFAQIVDYNKFDHYKLLPSLYKVGTIETTAEVGDPIFDFPVTPSLCPSVELIPSGVMYFPTHICNLASHFSYYKGGMKFLIKFFASGVNARVMITYIPNPLYTATIDADDEGNTVNKIVEISSDTSVNVLIPYLKETQWTEVPDIFDANAPPVTTFAGYNGQLKMKLIQPIQCAFDPTFSKIHYAIFVSGAEDMEFARPKMLWPGYIDGTELPEGVKKATDVNAQMEKVTEQTDLRLAFRSQFESLIPSKVVKIEGIQMGEHIGSWPELLKRYAFYKTDTVSALFTGNTYDPLKVQLGEIKKFQRILRNFQFLRGGYRMKLLSNGVSSHFYYATNYNDTDTNVSDIRQLMCDNGGVVMDNTQQRVLEFEIPFYTKFAMITHGMELEIENYPKFKIGNLSGGTGATFDLYISASDDFTLGWPISPIPLKKLPASKELEK